MEKIKSKLKDHIIICGAGNIGKYVIKELLKEKKRKIVVIDSDTSFINNLQKELTEANENKNNIFFIEANPSKEEILINHAMINSAYGLITCLPNDSNNLLVSLTVKNLNPKVKVTAFVIDEENIPKFYLVGVDDVISANLTIGKRLAISMMNENILTFIEQVSIIKDKEYYFGDIIVEQNSSIIGKTLKELNLTNNFDILVIAIKSSTISEYIFNPKAEYRIKENDILIVMGQQENIMKLNDYVKKT